MRELKFRGIAENGKMYSGLMSIGYSSAYIGTPPVYYIYNSVDVPWGYEVNPETIGQYTGLKDNNGKEIYEGDIVQIQSLDPRLNINSEDIRHECMEVYFLAPSFCMRGYTASGDFKIEDFKYTESLREVIGNIYENPELIPKAPEDCET